MKLKKETLYIHRERGHLIIPEQKAKDLFGEVSSNSSLFFGDFVLTTKRPIAEKESAKENFFGGVPVFIHLDGFYVGKMSWRTGKIHFDTKKGLREVKEALEVVFLEKGIIQERKELFYKYCEICTRFPRKNYFLALERMRLTKNAFRTEWTHCHEKQHDSIELPYLYIAKNLLFNKYCLNLKIYLAVKYRNDIYSKDYIVGEDLTREPKIEVQISNIKNLETAKKEAIPIILAFLHSIRTNSLEMTEDDYELVEYEKKHLEPYQQIYENLSYHQPQSNFFTFKKKMTEIIRLRREAIIQEIIKKPLSKKEILNLQETSKNTVENDLKTLIDHKLICSRGRNGIAKMYAFNWLGLGNNRPPESLPRQSFDITRY